MIITTKIPVLLSQVWMKSAADLWQDLWWLLRRKQREEKATGRVYFYTNDTDKPRKRDYRDRDLMLSALGVQINPGSVKKGTDYDRFYEQAMDDIGRRIATNRDAR